MFPSIWVRLTLCLTAYILLQTALPTWAADPEIPTEPTAKPVLIFVGTYTSATDKGIQLLRFDPATGKLTSLGLAAEIANPSFLALSPDQHYLFAVSEAPAGPKNHGQVASFALEATTGKLTPLSQQDSTGNDPCHLTTDSLGGHLFVANYSSGSIAAFPIDAAGHLGQPTATIQHPTPTTAPSARQESPHAHGVNFGPNPRLLLATDLGLDQVLLYDYDASKGTLVVANPSAIKLSAGSGPRHLAFDPKGRYLYVVNELTSSITVLEHVTDLPVNPPLANTETPPIPSPFSPGTPGASFSAIQNITLLPPEFKGNSSAAEIVVHPSGRLLFASNRGHDSIAVFTIDAATGKLTTTGIYPTHGKTPRHFMIDPTGSLLLVANQNSNNITVFRIDPKNGVLTFTGEELKINAPVCLLPVANAK